jgi:hypothetical protein
VSTNTIGSVRFDEYNEGAFWSFFIWQRWSAECVCRRGVRVVGKRARRREVASDRRYVCSSSRAHALTDITVRDIMGSREKVELTVWRVPGLAAGV